MFGLPQSETLQTPGRLSPQVHVFWIFHCGHTAIRLIPTHDFINDRRGECLLLKRRSNLDLFKELAEALTDGRPKGARHVETAAGAALLPTVLEGTSQRGDSYVLHVGRRVHKVVVLASAFWQGKENDKV